MNSSSNDTGKAKSELKWNTYTTNLKEKKKTHHWISERTRRARRYYFHSIQFFSSARSPERMAKHIFHSWIKNTAIIIFCLEVFFSFFFRPLSMSANSIRLEDFSSILLLYVKRPSFTNIYVDEKYNFFTLIHSFSTFDIKNQMLLQLALAQCVVYVLLEAADYTINCLASCICYKSGGATDTQG